jgi:Fe-S-cluster containining protein
MNHDTARDDPSTARRYFFEDGLRFECTGCGACCTGAPGQVVLVDGEAQRIAAHLGCDVREFFAAFTRPVADGVSLAEHGNGDCIFLENRACRIHAVKPAQCGTFPFWRNNLRTETAWERTRLRCEGIGRGRLYSRDEILALINQDQTRTEESTWTGKTFYAKP